MGILDPQEEVWIGEAGMKYAFSEVKKFKGTVAPYNMICDFSKPFSGTLFRFPLRTKESKLSNKCNTILSLQTIFNALKKEAHCLLLFLRSVAKVEIIELPDFSKVVFHVSLVNKDNNEHQTTIFNSQNNQIDIIKIARECCIKVETIGHPPQQYTTHVVEQVGSEDPEVLEMAGELHLLPWVGVAFEIGKKDLDFRGKVFCCLPMPDEISSPLPVHVNGTFGVNDDRRTLKWKSTERQNDSVSQWNEMIISKILPSC